MPRSFWPAFSRSLVAVSICSLVTWHNVSWAIDVAMRCSAAFSMKDMLSGQAVSVRQLVQKRATVIPVVGLLRWYFPLQITSSASACRLSTTASGAMARCTLTSLKLPLPCTNKTKALTPTTKTRQTEKEGGGEVKGCDRPVMGLPCWHTVFFWGGEEKNTETIRPVNIYAYSHKGTTSRGSPTLAVLAV